MVHQIQWTILRCCTSKEWQLLQNCLYNDSVFRSDERLLSVTLIMIKDNFRYFTYSQRLVVTFGTTLIVIIVNHTRRGTFRATLEHLILNLNIIMTMVVKLLTFGHSSEALRESLMTTSFPEEDYSINEKIELMSLLREIFDDRTWDFGWILCLNPLLITFIPEFL